MKMRIGMAIVGLISLINVLPLLGKTLEGSGRTINITYTGGERTLTVKDSTGKLLLSITGATNLVTSITVPAETTQITIESPETSVTPPTGPGACYTKQFTYKAASFTQSLTMERIDIALSENDVTEKKVYTMECNASQVRNFTYELKLSVATVG